MLGRLEAPYCFIAWKLGLAMCARHNNCFLGSQGGGHWNEFEQYLLHLRIIMYVVKLNERKEVVL